jgi:hypothetical protein
MVIPEYVERAMISMQNFNKPGRDYAVGTPAFQIYYISATKVQEKHHLE